MAMQSVIQFITSLLLISAAPSVLAAPIANPGCDDHCGNIPIPYPFGIGPSCYFNPWFAIECNQTLSGPKAFLTSIDMEVLDIKVAGTLRVNNPIIFSKCNTDCRKGLNLTDSPFAFSSQNTFTAVGCNTRALMTHINPVVQGCESDCHGNGNNSCHNMSCCRTGTNCCSISLSDNINVFDANLKSQNTGKNEGCRYAFLADREIEMDPFAMRHKKDVPALLQWWLCFPNSTSEEPSKFPNSLGKFSTCSGPGYVSPKRNITLTCQCKKGYEGNPYLYNGCEDINECHQNHICSDTCVNTDGHFRCEKSRAFIVITTLGSSLGFLFVLFSVWWLYKLIKKRRAIKLKRKCFKRNGGLLLQQQLTSSEGNVGKIFNAKELNIATDNFNQNRIVGQGGQGTVYKGMLADGIIVAVKKSTIVDEDNLEQFINEVCILSRINHRNVVKLLGCCLETEVPLLVYEFIPNGTLSHYLHDQKDEFTVSWEMRLQIATEVAGALSYLHSAASLPIYHRDIKSTNILLDEKYRAKVSDFGTSRSLTVDQTHVTTLVHGTFGYLDPEYFQSSKFTDKSDVYSFGVVLVELLTGQKAISSTRSEEGMSLATNFITSMDGERQFDILDAQIVNQGGKDSIMAVAHLAKRCLNLNGRNRPTMREIAMTLEGIQISQKTFTSEQSSRD